MQNVICLIRDHAPLVYFVNSVHRVAGVSLVVIEDKPSRRMNDDERRSCEKWFGDAWTALDPAIPRVRVPSINGTACQAILQAEKPWLLLDHGTSLVRDYILACAERALNLHWGLSPYYRGVYCAEWALVNRDPHNIGVTIHELARAIDGGGIIAQRRATIAPGMTTFDIDMQLTFLGTELVRAITMHLRAGHPLAAVPQNLRDGFLFRARDMNEGIRSEARRILEDQELLREILRHPSRPAREIVQLEEFPEEERT